jgi:hypothetical protein
MQDYPWLSHIPSGYLSSPYEETLRTNCCTWRAEKPRAGELLVQVNLLLTLDSGLGFDENVYGK